ncbi:hypothetical protein [Kosakonia sp. S42]|uniref:hypothetical protein n=1 Tax=Kosakonia sp. S42 TaxID=2767458 RepID=UPI00190D980C|nr:hypothetical protein [Kosakonia sp. S42]MBK0018883.1 hypothetical protein [Kosakonia sp. S42]
MKKCINGLLLFAAGYAAAAPSPAFAPDWASCDISTRHNAAGETGGSIHDPLQAHISVRANVLQADIDNARILSETQAGRLWREVDSVRADANDYVKIQGFLSAAEKASYDRALDDIADRFCRAIR